MLVTDKMNFLIAPVEIYAQENVEQKSLTLHSFSFILMQMQPVFFVWWQFFASVAICKFFQHVIIWIQVSKGETDNLLEITTDLFNFWRKGHAFSGSSSNSSMETTNQTILRNFALSISSIVLRVQLSPSRPIYSFSSPVLAVEVIVCVQAT